MNGNKNLSYDYRLLVEEDLKEEFSDELSQPSSTTSSLRSFRHPWHIFRIPFRHAIRITLAFPLSACVFAIIWALYTHYDRAVNVLCANEDNRKVRNYLPSLSAAIGDFGISKTVWTLCIIIHSPPRFFYGSMYLEYFEAIVPPSHQKWAYLAWIFSFLEICGLLGLSIITSKTNLPFHALCFGTFLVSSETYMFLQCFLQSFGTKAQGPSGMEVKSRKIKSFLTKLVLVCTVLLVFTYIRHETYCEKGMYTAFAAVEYVIILSNMAFHGCAYWDFYDRVIVIDLCKLCITSTRSNLSWNF